MPFFLPQSLAKASNQVSYCGTKWLHWRIFSVLVWASAVDTNGAESAGARPAAPAMALVVLRKSRRVTDEFCLFPPYPIAQLLFARPTMMFPAVHAMTALDKTKSAARHHPDGCAVRSSSG